MIPTHKDYQKLYNIANNAKVSRPEQIKACAECDGCPGVWVYLYPGEFEYRRDNKLSPTFVDADVQIVGGDKLYKCPLHDGSKCEVAPLVCRLTPFQIYQRRGDRAIVVRAGGGYPEHPCLIESFTSDQVLAIVELVVELYVNLKVGEVSE